jgi:hypothetical protein
MAETPTASARFAQPGHAGFLIAEITSGASASSRAKRTGSRMSVALGPSVVVDGHTRERGW